MRAEVNHKPLKSGKKLTLGLDLRLAPASLVAHGWLGLAFGSQTSTKPLEHNILTKRHQHSLLMYNPNRQSQTKLNINDIKISQNTNMQVKFANNIV